MSTSSQIKLELIDSVSPVRPEHDDEALDVLQSHIIEGFEKAIDLGMAPMQAITHILDWIAEEKARITAAPVDASAAG